MIDDKEFMKDGVFCSQCPGRTNDHADYCKVPALVEERDAEIARKALEDRTEHGEDEQTE